MTIPTSYEQLGYNGPDGAQFGGSTGAKIAFYGATPVVRRTGIAQATVTLTLTTGGVGFVSTAQAQAVVDQINEIRAMLTQNGMWKGSA